MLADRNSGAEQDSVNRPRAAARVVDIIAVDSDQPGALLGEQPGRGFGQKRVAGKIGVGTPVPIPAGVDEHRLAGAFDARVRTRSPGKAAN